MQLTIFYSWQTTTKTQYNRYFILTCIKKATKQLKNNPLLKDVTYEVTEGVSSEPGSPAVASKIYEERIPNCDIFISDLSVINYQPSPWYARLADKFAKRDFKPAQNNNVIFEHATALAKLGKERIIGVLNNVYGSPNNNPDNIAFDLRAMRFPIEYSYEESNLAEKTEIQQKLINDLKIAIENTSIYALEHYKTKYNPFLVWEIWQNYIPKDQHFISNGKITEIYISIKEAVNTGNKIIRLIGLSGLGKTRIIFELFRPDGDEYSKKLSGRVLYLDCNSNSGININARIEEILYSKNEHLIILDNCPAEQCRSLKTLIKQSKTKASLITIDNNPEELHSNKISDVEYITIGKDELATVVDGIIKTDFTDLPSDSIEKIKEFSQGIPMMAVLLGESARKGERFIGKLDDKDLLDKLLGDYGKDPETKTVLKTSSLFNFFGYEGDLEPQLKFIATNQNITVTNNQPNVSEELFRKVIHHYLSRQIYEKKGRMIGMRPFPLAIYLASEWLEYCTDERLYHLLVEMASLNPPHGKQLAEAFAEQMKYLGFSPKANAIIEKITAPNNPFDNAEVLNTELGSRLFRAFVEVNPVAIAQNLYRNFYGKSLDELSKIVAGRRNLVWALEILCFDKRTFDEAIKVLCSFAAAENETWSNNATGTFLHLFNIHLAGTEALLMDRFKIITWSWNIDNFAFKKLSINAMGKGLNYGHFHRMSGPEKQGTKMLKDHEPNKNEIIEYWTAIITLLKKIYMSYNDFSILAAKILLDSLRGIASAGLIDIILPTIKEISLAKNNDWNDAIRPIKTMLKYEGHFLTKNAIEEATSLIDLLTKDDFISKFTRLIANPRIDFTEGDSYENNQKKIEELASEFINGDLNWEKTIPFFTSGYHYSAFNFGKGIAEQLINERIKLFNFIDILIKSLSSIEKSQRNVTVLGGIYLSADEGIQHFIKSQVKRYTTLEYLLFWIISISKTWYNETEELFRYVDSGKFSVNEFETFSQNGYIDIDEYKIIHFCERLFTYGKEGYRIAFKIAQNAFFLNSKSTQHLLPILKTCIIELGIIDNASYQLDYYQWWETIGRILKEDNESDFAKLINQAIIQSISWQNTYHLDNTIQNIYEILISKYFDHIWSDLSVGLLGKDELYVKFYGLKNILGSSNGHYAHSNGTLFRGKLDVIFCWCNENEPLAPSRIASLTPIFAEGKNEQNPLWHPVARLIIDKYGMYDDVLSELNSNIGTFSWSGSLIPYLKMEMKLMEEIQAHPIQQVADWAKSQILYLQRRMNYERDRDAERNIR